MFSTQHISSKNAVGNQMSTAFRTFVDVTLIKDHEFFCDRFVALYLSHNFSGMLWKTNSAWFRPELSVITNIGWGDMKRAEAYTLKNFKTMEKGYFESGIVVNGLLATPLTKIGVGAFYRYGPYSMPNVWDNFAWKWCASISL